MPFARIVRESRAPSPRACPFAPFVATVSVGSSSTPLAGHEPMRAAAVVVFVIAFVLALAACFGPKHPRGGPSGTNIGTGSENDGPWNSGGGGGSPALTDPSR
jgi:hypothetical protein